MEYVAGRTLRDILREGRKILPERALEITSGVLAALDYSHRAGIIHRDIKPGNVMLTPTGDVKVMDFGIARAIADASSTMTQTAAVVGTAQYLSPEQARGETVDSRSDVYSTGCLLYELLTGRPPFVGDSPVVGGLPARPRAGAAAVVARRRPAARDRRDRDEGAGQAASRTATRAPPRCGRTSSATSPASRCAAPAVPVGDATAFIPPTARGHLDLRRPAPADDEDGASRSRKRWPLVLVDRSASSRCWSLGRGARAEAVQLGARDQDRCRTLVSMTQAAGRGPDHGGRAERRRTVDQEASEDVPKGRVIAQDPDPLRDAAARRPGRPRRLDGQARRGGAVRHRDDKDTARQKLDRRRAAGQAGQAGVRRAAGHRDRHRPAPGDQRHQGQPGDGVLLRRARRRCPSVVGLKEGAARTQAEEGRLRGRHGPGLADRRPQKGTVLKQSPPAFTTQPQGTTVVITVSTYEPPTPTPTPTPRRRRPHPDADAPVADADRQPAAQPVTRAPTPGRDPGGDRLSRRPCAAPVPRRCAVAAGRSSSSVEPVVARAAAAPSRLDRPAEAACGRTGR